MRFMQKRPSGRDKDIPVYEFAFGKVELELLLAMSETAFKNMPIGFEFQQHRARLRNILRTIKNVLNENYERKNTKVNR